MVDQNGQPVSTEQGETQVCTMIQGHLSLLISVGLGITLHSSTIPLRPLENGITFPQGRVNRISPSIWFPLGGRNVRQEVQESDKGTKVGAISE